MQGDFDHEFHYGGRPVLPLASADPDGAVAYVGTLSKVLAPALRIGYVVAPTDVIDRIAAYRSHIDTQGDQVLEYAVAELLEDGAIQRHIRRMRREYRARRDVLVAALREHLDDYLTFTVPAGGIALWVKGRGELDVDAWARAPRGHGAMIVTASAFALGGRSRPDVRLEFASLTARELQEGVRRLRAAVLRQG